MPRLSITGKRWTEPAIEMPETPEGIVAALRAARMLGHGTDAWKEETTYPMALRAAERLRAAATQKETVGIIGDYDCDGLTSTAILVRLMRRMGIDPIVRLPHRLREGYGVHMAHIEEMLAQGVTLLFTTDTGIVATDALTHAQEEGIDVIVLDHHAYTALPPAFAILHPRLTSLRAPPAAAGIACTFAHAVEGDWWDDRDTDLALAAIGTIADVVPLTHENRSLVHEGLAALGRIDRETGLGALRDQSGIGTLPRSGDVAFRLAPRLNAAGRLGDATIGLHALLGDRASVDALETLNAKRQELTRACMDEAMAMLDDAALPGCICVAAPSFPRGIIGLLAGKLTERFGRPSIAVAIEGEHCTASLRSIPGYDIAAALGRHAHLLQTFGGHAQAGGCSFDVQNLAIFTEALHHDVLATVPPDHLHAVVAIDARTTLAFASLKLSDALSALEPFGAENREPLFLIPALTLSQIRRVGSDQQHLQARIGPMSAIGFGLGHVADQITGPVDLACRITANEWNGERRAQLSIVDLRAAV